MKYSPKVTISLFCSYMHIFHITSSTVSPALALKDCEFPAIFNFGDSNSDTGGLVASQLLPLTTPYGETYFHMPVGRFSDGRLIIDFLAQSLGHPYLSAYLDSLATNFSHGANFATAASTIRLPDLIKPAAGGYSPFYLDIQYVQLMQLKSRAQLIRHRGGILASLMPKEDYFSKALYTFDVGQNDLNEGFFGNVTIQEFNVSVPDIITGFSTNIKKIYDLGARTFWIHNTGPIGCLPYIVANFPSAQQDEVGCLKAYNEVAQHFNHELKQAIVQLRKDLPLAAFTYVDVYSVKYSLFKEPERYAQSLGHPYLSAYLDSLGTNFSHGANFATAASTIRLPDHVLPAGGFSPFYLNIQYGQFLQLKSRSQLIRHRGGIFASLMPKEDYFAKALYTFDIGQNDLGEGFFGNMTIQEVNASVPDIITGFSTNIKKIYDLGARSFWIHNTGPIGCLPYILVNFPSAQKDEVGCAKAYNEVAQHFNHELKQAIVQLRQDLPLAAFTSVDVYSVKYSLFKEPEKHGFELPLVACCGYGGKYNYNSSAGCGATTTVNGSQIFVGSCKNPSARVNWDGIHYTEAAAKYVFDKISTGAYSDPPLPFKEACHRSFK